MEKVRCWIIKYRSYRPGNALAKATRRASRMIRKWGIVVAVNGHNIRVLSTIGVKRILGILLDSSGSWSGVLEIDSGDPNLIDCLSGISGEFELLGNGRVMVSIDRLTHHLISFIIDEFDIDYIYCSLNNGMSRIRILIRSVDLNSDEVAKASGGGLRGYKKLVRRGFPEAISRLAFRYK